MITDHPPGNLHDGTQGRPAGFDYRRVLGRVKAEEADTATANSCDDPSGPIPCAPEQKLVRVQVFCEV